MRKRIGALALVLAGGLALADAAEAEQPVHGLAMHGSVKYGPGFQHFDYVDPKAPKGGTVTMGTVGTYDSLNPFILKGVPAAGLGFTFDTLTVSSSDEAFSEYGAVAESIETPEDRSWVAYTLRPEARFNDGTPITVDDVIFTFETLKTKGAPFYASYYAKVARAEKVGERKVKFSFSGDANRELPLIIGQLPVLPKRYWQGRDFEKTTLDPPVGSGPYRIAATEPGRSITFQRVADWWAKDLPINRGRYNYDTIRIDYYRDPNVALEAFKAGEFDFREENSARAWATAYDIPAIKDGTLKRETIKNEIPTGIQGFGFNARRRLFQDRRVRQALGYAFDFEWSNKTLFYGLYQRERSYFFNSELASSGPPSPEELTLLAPYRGKVPEEVFTSEYRPPETDGSGNLRDNLREALKLLGEAGWQIKGGKLVDAKGQPFEFEIMLDDQNFERVTLPFVKNLERLGIVAKVRTVDTAQSQKRQEEFDYDMLVVLFPESLSPGNEQRDFWGSAQADIPGSSNLLGVKDPVVDALVEQIIAAPDRQQLIWRTRALDRVLLWSHYIIPHFTNGAWWLAYWDKFGRPATIAKYALGTTNAWWVDPEREATLARRRGR